MIIYMCVGEGGGEGTEGRNCLCPFVSTKGMKKRQEREGRNREERKGRRQGREWKRIGVETGKGAKEGGCEAGGG